jgi:hypothetical protein
VATDAVANLKVVEHNHHLNLENKLENLKSIVENVAATNNKIKSHETEQNLLILRKELGNYTLCKLADQVNW